MTLNFVIAPDFSPERLAGWHMLNTCLQKKAGISIHLHTPASAKEQAQLIAEGKADLLYANPFDSASMIRDAGYLSIARPLSLANEVVIAAKSDSAIQALEELQPGTRIALTDNKDVKLIGLRLLEVADIADQDIDWHITDSYQAAARQVLKGDADVCFMLASVYHSLSRLTKEQLKPLVESRLDDISHVILLNKNQEDKKDILQSIFQSLPSRPEGQAILDELGIPKGFALMSKEDGDFMIDMIETLLD